MEVNLKIPYENGGAMNHRASLLHHFMKNRDVQMKYTRAAVESGNYRTWITQLTEEEIEKFIAVNKERILKGFEYKTFGPKFHEDYFWRNALYSLELYYRHNDGTISQDVYDVWIEEVMADKQYYEGKLKVAMAEFHKKTNNAEPDKKSSFVTPYY